MLLIIKGNLSCGRSLRGNSLHTLRSQFNAACILTHIHGAKNPARIAEGCPQARPRLDSEAEPWEARKAKVILGTMRPRSKATLLFVESIVCLPDKGRRGYCGPYQLDSSRAPAPWGEQLPGGRREAPYVSLLNQNVRPLPVLYPQVSSPESRTVEV
jgi:hypothetical protein